MPYMDKVTRDSLISMAEDLRSRADSLQRIAADSGCPCGGHCDTGARRTERDTTVCVDGTHFYENGGWSCDYAGPGGCQTPTHGLDPGERREDHGHDPAQ